MSVPFNLIAVCRAPTVEALRGAMFHAAARADLLELRLDDLEPEERRHVAGCFQAPPRPTLATVRRPADGGAWEGEESDRVALLEAAARAGADWIDLEWGSPALELLERSHGAGRIVSHHHLERFPDDAEDLAGALAEAGGNLVKLALRCEGLREVVRLGAICRGQAERGVPTIAVPLGEEATWGRLWAPAWGAWGGFFRPARGRGGPNTRSRKDPALPSLEEALDLYRIDEVEAATPLFAVIGRGVRHSLSPSIHMAALDEAGVDGLYVPLEIEKAEVEDLLLHPEEFPFAGFSVTSPHKTTAVGLVTRLEGAAAEAGALNTVRREPDGTTTGFNTDGAALRSIVEERLELAGARAVVLGAGGAARGVVHALQEAGTEVLVLNRTAERARALAEDLGCAWGLLPGEQGAVAEADLVVNATPLGDRAGPEGGRGVNPVSEVVLREGGGLVVDLVYRPRVTRLLREAARFGWETVDGTEVLVRQAALQFRIWNGIEPDLDAMRAAL